MISVEDSTCLVRLNNVELNTDSTEKFIFGKNKEPIN